MKHYRVIIEPQALDDLDGYYQRVVAAGAKANADRWFNRIVETILALEVLPEAGSPIPEQDQFEVRLYQRVFAGRYRILYAVEGATVHVLCVRGAGMRELRPSDMEPERS